VAFTKEYGEISIEIFGYRTWSSPYELTLNIKDTGNIPRHKRGSTKYIDANGSVYARHKTTADGVTLKIENDEYIKITGLESKRNVQVDCPNNQSFFVSEDNCLGLSGSIVNFYLEEQLEKFVIDEVDYTEILIILKEENALTKSKISKYKVF
jgi:hypothetical protein